MVETRSQRPTGLRCLKTVPWGTHLCQFYRARDEFFDLVADFIQAGLKEEEYCFWVVPKGITLRQAIRALEERVAGFDKFHLLGQIELASSERWYYEPKKPFNPQWSLRKLHNAYEDQMKERWSGIRGIGDGSLAAARRRDNRELLRYERAVHKEMPRLSAIFLCTYNVRSCSRKTLTGLVDSHHYSLIRKGLRWEALQRNYSLGF